MPEQWIQSWRDAREEEKGKGEREGRKERGVQEGEKKKIL